MTGERVTDDRVTDERVTDERVTDERVSGRCGPELNPNLYLIRGDFSLGMKRDSAPRRLL